MDQGVQMRLLTCLVVAAVFLSAIGCSTSKPQTQEQPDRSGVEATQSQSVESPAQDAQQNTIDALKAVQLACEAYAVDWDYYPTANSMIELRPIVTPTYMHDHDLPDLDGFGNPLAIRSDPDGYLVGSVGADGKANTNDDLCLSQEMQLIRGGCGLVFPE
jgi:hypothetical protein